MAEIKFEDALKKLTTVVEELEKGNISLDKAIKKYQEGMLLSKHCFELLDKAKKKIQICLKEKDSSVKIKPFKEKDYVRENQ